MTEINSTKILKKILTQYYQSFFPKDGKKPKVAWCSSVGPAEILIALGFKVYYPENHGALLGATRTSNNYIPISNALGYSPDICSYMTSDIGAFLKNETPLKKVYDIPSPPKPDVLVYATNQCREMQDWFSFYARRFNVPTLGVHYPWKIDEIKKSQIDYAVTELKALINNLEQISNTKLEVDKLKEVTDISAQTSKLWKKFLEKAQKIPSSFNFFDSLIQMAPAVVLRGTKEAINYYKILNEEIDQKIKNNEASVQKEEIRLYWDGMPIWGKLRFFSELLEKENACVVASTYCNSWIFESKEKDDPLRYLAEGYLKIFINRSENIKQNTLKNLADNYKIDGIIFHDSKTCPYNSNTRFGLPQRMNEEYKIPYLVIDADLNDLRCFSEEQTKTAIQTFVEQLKDKKG